MGLQIGALLPASQLSPEGPTIFLDVEPGFGLINREPVQLLTDQA
jgi:hypothetical protein